jgi:integrase
LGLPKAAGLQEALRFFFTIMLGRVDLAHQLARTHYPRKLLRVLTLDQVARLLEAAPGPGLKHKAALGIAYGAGPRGGEVVMLRVSDIDLERMLIRVEMGSLSQARDGDQMLCRPRDRHRERGRNLGRASTLPRRAFGRLPPPTKSGGRALHSQRDGTGGIARSEKC